MKHDVSKKVALYSLLLLLIFLSSSLIFFYKYIDLLFFFTKEKISAGLTATASAIDWNDFKSIDKDSYDTSLFKQNWNKIKSIEKNLNLSFIYIIFFKDSDHLYFAYDTAHEFGSLDSRNNYLKIYKDPPTEIFESIRLNRIVFLEGIQKNQWGNLYSGFLPIQKNGKVISVIGVDVNVSSFLELKKNASIIITLAITLGLIIISLILYNLFFNLVRPLNIIHETVDQIAHGNTKVAPILKSDDFSEIIDNLNKLINTAQLKVESAEQNSNSYLEKLKQRKEDLKKALQSEQKLLGENESVFAFLTKANNAFSSNQFLDTNITSFSVSRQIHKNFIDQKRYSTSGFVYLTKPLNLLGTKNLFFAFGDTQERYLLGLISATILNFVIQTLLIKQEKNKRTILKESDRWLQDFYWQVAEISNRSGGDLKFLGSVGLIEEETGLVRFYSIGELNLFLYRDGKAASINEVFKTVHQDSENEKIFLNELQLYTGDQIFFGSMKHGGLKVDPDKIIYLIELTKGDSLKMQQHLSNFEPTLTEYSIFNLSYNSKQ